MWGGDDPGCEHEWGGEKTLLTGRNDADRLADGLAEGHGGGTTTPKQQATNGAFCRRCGAWRGSLGLEPTLELYLDHIVEICREVRRVMRSDATFFLNVGDSYAGGGRGGNPAESSYRKQATNRGSLVAPSPISDGLKPKDLMLVPHRLAIRLCDDGWWVRSDIIWCLSGGTRVYARTQKGDMPTTIKDLVRLDPATVKLWNGEKWTQVLDWTQAPRPDKTYEIELRSGERIGCTAEHRWPVEGQGDDILTTELHVGDVIRNCRLPEPDDPRKPESLSDEDTGWLVGTFLADGSWAKDRTAFNIASNAGENIRFDRLRRIAASYDGRFSITFHEGKGCAAIIHGRILAAILGTYLSGENADGKHLDVRCWRRTDRFLHSLLLGYLQGDGHWESDAKRWRVGFTKNDALAADLRTLCARLGYQCRLRRYVHQSQWGEYPGWRGEIRFVVSDHHNRKSDGEIVAIRESRARKFWDISVEDEPHLFSLASGVLTHNSKRAPMPESCNNRPTSAHEHMLFLTKSGAPTFWTHRDHAGSRTKPAPDYRWVDHDNDDAETDVEPPNWRTEMSRDGKRKRWSRINLWDGHDYFYDAEAVKEHGEMKPQNRFTDGKGPKAAGYAAHRQPTGMTECSSRNLRNVWLLGPSPFPDAHFATFPPRIAEIPILAGSSAKGVCPQCGAGWARMVEVERRPNVNHTRSKSDHYRSGDVGADRRERSDRGWRPSCGCKPICRMPEKCGVEGGDVCQACRDPIPATVLDPFLGSGTTALVADRLGRDCIGIELSPAYVRMAEKRLRDDGGMFMEIAAE